MDLELVNLQGVERLPPDKTGPYKGRAGFVLLEYGDAKIVHYENGTTPHYGKRPSELVFLRNGRRIIIHRGVVSATKDLPNIVTMTAALLRLPVSLINLWASSPRRLYSSTSVIAPKRVEMAVVGCNSVTAH